MRTAAFGLDLECRFAAPGFSHAVPEPAKRPTVLRLVAADELEHWTLEEPAVLYQQAGAPHLTIRRHRALGVRLDHDFFGSFAVASDGGEVSCAPRAELCDWIWQRFLVGQVLPLASTLRGLEPLHASAVEVGGRALLLVGRSGAGKSSVALQLVDRGARLLADDVAALDTAAGKPFVHPGPALMSADPAELARVRADGPLSRWQRLGTLEEEVRLAGPAVVAQPVPVAAVLVLRRTSDAAEVSIEALRQAVPAVLLGATFNAYLRDPHRVVRQLDVCEALARSAAIRTVRSGPRDGARSTAAAAARWLEAL